MCLSVFKSSVYSYIMFFCLVWKDQCLHNTTSFYKIFFFPHVIYNLFAFLLGPSEQCLHTVYSCNLSFPLFFLFWIHTFNSFLPQLHLLTDKCSISSSSLYLDIFPCYSTDSSGNFWFEQIIHVLIYAHMYILAYN